MKDRKAICKRYYEKNKEKCLAANRLWNETHPDATAEISRRCYAKNGERWRAEVKERRVTDPDFIESRREMQRNWREKNPDKCREYEQQYRSVPDKRLHKIMSRAVWGMIKNKDNTSWTKLVGYDAATLFNHLSSTMPEGYTWDDWGRDGLHIDHIIPKVAFNITDANCIDFQRCWSLKNLRLIPAKENLQKHDKLAVPFQPSLAIAV
jgi:hypothetical protein